jgi:hypothetical protein
MDNQALVTMVAFCGGTLAIVGLCGSCFYRSLSRRIEQLQAQLAFQQQPTPSFYPTAPPAWPHYGQPGP